MTGDREEGMRDEREKRRREAKERSEREKRKREAKERSERGSTLPRPLTCGVAGFLALLKVLLASEEESGFER